MRQIKGVPPQAGSGHSPSGLSQSSLSQAQPSVPNAACVECERLREEIADYLGHRTDNIAGKLWAAQHLFSKFKGALEDLIGDVEKFGHDEYDASLEIYGAADDLRLSEEAQRLIRDAGFHKVYVNHSGDRDSRRETHYTFNGELPVRGWRRQRTEKGFNISYWPEGWNSPGCADWLETGYMTIVPDPLDPFAASAIEAATAGETVKHGSTEGESAVAESETPNPHLSPQGSKL